MAEVKAQLNNLRMAPRKVRAVGGLIKGKKVSDALNQLEYFTRRPVSPIKKLVLSALANAENNLNMVKENLYIKSLIVDEGVKLRRFKAKGFGRAAVIQKKTSHIRLILDELKPGLRLEKGSRPNKTENSSEAKEDVVRQGESKQGKPEIKREMGSKGNVLGNLGKRIFQRKSV